MAHRSSAASESGLRLHVQKPSLFTPRSPAACMLPENAALNSLFIPRRLEFPLAPQTLQSYHTS